MMIGLPHIACIRCSKSAGQSAQIAQPSRALRYSPSENRSASYRHGFANGRDDRRGKPRASFEALIAAADAAMVEDDRR